MAIRKRGRLCLLRINELPITFYIALTVVEHTNCGSFLVLHTFKDMTPTLSEFKYLASIITNSRDVDVYAKKLCNQFDSHFHTLAKEEVTRLMEESMSTKNYVFAWYCLDNIFHAEREDREFGTFKELLSIIYRLIDVGETNMTWSISKPIMSVLTSIVDILIKNNKYQDSFNLCIKSIKWITGEDKTIITSLHGSLFLSALKIGKLEEVLPYVIYDDVKFLNESRGIVRMSGCKNHCLFHSEYLLQFYYYGGLIMTALGSYEDAFLFFEMCTIIPASEDAMSAIALEAFKKGILVGIIAFKKSVPLSSFLVPAFIRELKNDAAHYDTFCNILDGGLKINFQQYSLLKNVSENCGAKFNNDSNYGLVKRIMWMIMEESIIGYSKIYSTMKIQKLHKKSFVPENCDFEDQLKKLINSGKLNARIINREFIEFLPPKETNAADVYKAVGQMEMIKRRMNCLDILLKAGVRGNMEEHQRSFDMISNIHPKNPFKFDNFPYLSADMSAELIDVCAFGR
uniref:COP9 signalosome complex subunit 3 n=1 Tax=Rhabditophanes sp. KR3021 TaxID=114890 RepID=A0AC35U4F4_9BILA